MTTPRQGNWGHSLHAPYQPHQAHLTDLDLLRPDRPRALEKHLADCGDCLRRLKEAQPVGDFDDYDFEHLVADPPAVSWQAPRLPDAVRQLMDPTTNPDTVRDVQAGQVWRLAWLGHRMLVGVIDITDWHVTVAPATTDVEYADEYTFTVQAEHLAIQTPLAIFARVAGTVPLFAFDVLVADLPGHTARTSAAARLIELRRTHLAGTAPPEPASPALNNDDADRIGFFDALSASLRLFIAAGSEAEAEEAELEGSSLQELLGMTSITPKVLTERAGVPLARVLDIMRGDPPTEQEKTSIELVIGSTFRAAELPDEAIAAISRPIFRQARAAWNVKHQRSPDTPPIDMARDMYVKTAARSDPSRRTNWTDRAALFFAADGE